MAYNSRAREGQPVEPGRRTDRSVPLRIDWYGTPAAKESLGHDHYGSIPSMAEALPRLDSTTYSCLNYDFARDRSSKPIINIFFKYIFLWYSLYLKIGGTHV